ncbi:hypothetical protein WJX79_005083 [Trebouxia sp. C0005]
MLHKARRLPCLLTTTPQPKRSVARPSASVFRPTDVIATGGPFGACTVTSSVHEERMPDRKMLRMGQLRHRPLFPAHVSRVTNSKFGKDSVTALNGQRTALNDCKLPSIFEQMPSVRSKMFQGLQDVHSGRAYLEHTQGVSGLKMIDREPWIEVTGIEMGSGSLPDHHQHGSHSAQLETMGKAKKQRCSLNSSAGGNSSLQTFAAEIVQQHAAEAISHSHATNPPAGLHAEHASQPHHPLGGVDPMAGMGQAFFDPTSAAAAQHSPCESTSFHYAPFAHSNPRGSFSQQAATPPSPYLQTSTPPMNPTHQSAFLDWTAPPPPPGQGATPQLPSINCVSRMRGNGGNPRVAIKQEETEFESGFMPDPHHVAGRPEIVSSLGYSADTRSPSLYAADAYIASRQQGTTAGLNGLLHGDSGISASSQILLDMGVRPRNSTPTSRRDEPLKGPAAAAQTGPAVTLPGRGQAMTRVARHVREACLKKTWEYEESEVVWAQSRGHPWWPAMVQKPTKEQEQATKMTHGKVFVVYFGTMEIEAVTHRCIQPWSAMVAPTAPQGSLKAALDLAKDLAPDSTVV